jgi:hypothetical protein
MLGSNVERLPADGSGAERYKLMKGFVWQFMSPAMDGLTLLIINSVDVASGRHSMLFRPTSRKLPESSSLSGCPAMLVFSRLWFFCGYRGVPRNGGERSFFVCHAFCGEASGFSGKAVMRFETPLISWPVRPCTLATAMRVDPRQEMELPFAANRSVVLLML